MFSEGNAVQKMAPNPMEIKAYARLLHMDRKTPCIHLSILYMLGFH